MEQRLLQYQEEIRLANEALVSKIKIYFIYEGFLHWILNKTCTNNLNFFFRDDLRKQLIFWQKNPVLQKKKLCCWVKKLLKLNIKLHNFV